MCFAAMVLACRDAASQRGSRAWMREKKLGIRELIIH